MVIEEFKEIVRVEHFIAAVLGPILNMKLKQ